MLCSALVSVLLYFAIAGYSRFIESTSIDGAAQAINDVLSEARQDAVTQGTPIEVRLYAASGANGYSALQLRWRDSDGTTPAAAPVQLLSRVAVIDATALHSSLVSTNSATPPPDPTDSRLNALTRCFHFLPDGSTDLAATGPWTLTVRAASQSDPNHFPANWACVEVDPATGRTQIYRP